MQCEQDRCLPQLPEGASALRAQGRAAQGPHRSLLGEEGWAATSPTASRSEPYPHPPELPHPYPRERLFFLLQPGPDSPTPTSHGPTRPSPGLFLTCQNRGLLFYVGGSGVPMGPLTAERLANHMHVLPRMLIFYCMC